MASNRPAPAPLRSATSAPPPATETASSNGPAQPNSAPATGASEAPKRVPPTGGGRKKSAPANETPAERFRRLARARMPKALKALNSVGTLGGRGYESTDDQKKKILKDLRAALDRIETAFSAPSPEKAKAAEYDI